jgi:hypothetical protein
MDVAPPDENLVAIGATFVSLAIVLPLLIKWWPKAMQRTSTRTSASGGAPRSARPAPTPIAGARRPRVADRAPIARAAAPTARAAVPAARAAAPTASRSRSPR